MSSSAKSTKATARSRFTGRRSRCCSMSASTTSRSRNCASCSATSCAPAQRAAVNFDDEDALRSGRRPRQRRLLRDRASRRTTRRWPGSIAAGRRRASRPRSSTGSDETHAIRCGSRCRGGTTSRTRSPPSPGRSPPACRCDDALSRRWRTSKGWRGASTSSAPAAAAMTVIDDFGHNPEKCRATLRTLKAQPGPGDRLLPAAWLRPAAADGPRTGRDLRPRALPRTTSRSCATRSISAARSTAARAASGSSI